MLCNTPQAKELRYTSVSFKMGETARIFLLIYCAASIATAQAGPAALITTVDSSTVASSANSTANTSFDFFYFVRHACSSSDNAQSVSLPACLKEVTVVTCCMQAVGPGLLRPQALQVPADRVSSKCCRTACFVSYLWQVFYVCAHTA